MLGRIVWKMVSVWFLAAVSLACASRDSVSQPSARERQAAQVEQLFEGVVGASVADPSPREWDFRAPSNVRPCCAFGYDLKVKLGAMPVPMFRMSNVVESSALGRHTFDPSMMSMENDATSGFLSAEVNGLAYTCRGGFIDIAHVRDYADWTVYLTGRIEELLDGGGVIELPDEAGDRFVYIASPTTAMVEAVGRRQLALELAQWVAFRLSIWHEVATWYRWSTWGAFPEEASAFSPEDLYSNLVGIKTAAAIVRSSSVVTRLQYNANMDAAVRSVLERLGAVPSLATRHAAASVDGLWWDSSRRLPDKGVVVRRNFHTGPELIPWQVPAARRSAELLISLQRHCRDVDAVAPLIVPDTVGGVGIDSLVRLDVRVSPEVADRIATLRADDRWLSHRDVDRLVELARAENKRQFGDDADHPG